MKIKQLLEEFRENQLKKGVAEDSIDETISIAMNVVTTKLIQEIKSNQQLQEALTNHDLKADLKQLDNEENLQKLTKIPVNESSTLGDIIEKYFTEFFSKLEKKTNTDRNKKSGLFGKKN